MDNIPQAVPVQQVIPPEIMGDSMNGDLYRFQLDYEALLENIEATLSGKVATIKPVLDDKGKIVGQQVEYADRGEALCTEQALKFIRPNLRMYLDKNFRSSKLTDWEISNIVIGVYERLYVGLSKDLEGNGFSDLDGLDFVCSMITDSVKASLNAAINGFTFEGAIKRINIHTLDNKNSGGQSSPPGVFGFKR